MITAEGGGRRVCRNSPFFKKITNVDQSNFNDDYYDNDDDYDYDNIAHQNNIDDLESNVIHRYPRRIRSLVQRFGNNIYER